MRNSNIEWTDHTYIPWVGCTNIPGVNGGPSAYDHCYAEGMAARLAPTWAKHHCIILEEKVWGKTSPRLIYPYDSKKFLDPYDWDRKAKRAGRLDKVFCSSMCDIMERRPISTNPAKRCLRLLSAPLISFGNC
jgi:protein gp37